MENQLFNYIIQHADNCLILSHRLSEWCGHGPVLEQDIAMTNISLDLLGQARMLYDYAAKVQGEGKTEDDLAYLRDAWDFKNVQLVEMPNGDFAQTILRQFLFDTFNISFYNELMEVSNDAELIAIADKSRKEAQYHLKWSSEWMLRLGQGTEESHARLQNAADELMVYANEVVIPSEADKVAAEAGYGVDLNSVKAKRDELINEVITECELNASLDGFSHTGGKTGTHTEHLGYVLAEMQFLQRAYPGLEW